MKSKLIGLAALAFSFSVMSSVKASPIDDGFNRLVHDGVFEISSVAPDNRDSIGFLETVPNTYIKNQLGDKYFGNLSNCNENYECDLEMSYFENLESEPSESRSERVKVVWQNAIENVKVLVDDYMNKIYAIMSEGEGVKSKVFTLTDLSLINGLYHSKDGKLESSKGIYYVNELKNILDNGNLTYSLDPRLGDAAPFYEMSGGIFSLWYNSVAYAALSDQSYIGVANNFILYIPENTENTTDAYIAAAKKRIDDYLGKNDVKIELAGKIDDIEGIDNSYINIDKTKTGDFYYKLTINGQIYDYLIMKSQDIAPPVTETKDLVTNVTIKTTSPDVPLDTKVTVEEIANNTQEFKSFVDTLKKDVIKAFNISLHSSSIGNITKLEKGVFQVSLPLGANYIGRRLSAYYIKDDGSVEEHPITLDANGLAVFETTHFSTYIIADASNRVTEEVPKTFDKVDIYIMLAVSGVIGLLSSIVFFRTKTN